MPESAAPVNKTIVLWFAALCLAAVVTLIYFAQSAASQSAPAYSTLNTGPQGAKLLFDGLRDAKFVSVSRQYKPISVQKPRNATVFFLGFEAWSLQFEDKAFFASMEESAKQGNLLVMALPYDKADDYSVEKSDKPKKKDLLETRWGIRLISEKGIYSAFPIVDKTWQPMPDVGTDVWQRTFGKGKIVLIANGQRLDNQAVAKDPASRRMLHQLVSQHPTAVFEEAHLGINETGSIVGLARHYHLQGLIFGFILLALLFVWSRSVSFPPAPPAQEKTMLGTDTRSMLTELMSRHLKGQLISTCVMEWNRTRSHAPALALPSESNPVAAYTQIQNSMQKKNKFTI